jgi:hypothetical protein
MSGAQMPVTDKKSEEEKLSFAFPTTSPLFIFRDQL